MSYELEAVTVVVFAKAPRKGRVKTRLAADLGDEQALAAYECFVGDIAETVGGLSDSLYQTVSPVLAYAGDPDHEGFDVFRAAGFEFAEQGDGDLGDRLTRVTEACFERGAEKLVIIGTDSPTLGPRHFLQTLSALGENDVVVGPSFDGGYYLIGLRGAHSEVFAEIDWSTQNVFGQTMRRCRESSLLCESLEFWYDVDTFDDLKLLKTHLFDYLRYREPEIASRTAEFLEELGDRGVFTRPPTKNGRVVMGTGLAPDIGTHDVRSSFGQASESKKGERQGRQAVPCGHSPVSRGRAGKEDVRHQVRAREAVQEGPGHLDCPRGSRRRRVLRRVVDGQ